MIISKKSWHYQLQQYVMGTVPKYSGLCPYFWMTLACMLFLVPVSIKRKLYDPLVELSRKFNEKMHRKYILGLDEEQLYNYYKRVPRWKFDDDFWVLINEGKYQETDLYKFLEQFANRKWTEMQKNVVAERRLVEIIEKTSNILKKIGKYAGYVFLGAVSVFLVGVIVVMFYEIHTKGQWRSFFIAIGIILTVLITFGAIYIVHDNIKNNIDGTKSDIVHDNIKYSEGYHSSKKKLGKLVTAPFKFVYTKIKSAVDFIFENYCPRIELQD